MLTIYGNNLSLPSNKIRFVANALELRYEYKQLNLRGGEHKTKEYLEIHPAGKVPAIDDDGFRLFESNAIIKYLAANADNRFYSNDIRERALIDQWVDFATAHIGQAMNRVFFNAAIGPLMGMEVDERSLADGRKFLSQFLPVVDARLAKSNYFGSKDITLADFVLLACLDPAEVCKVDLAPYSKLCKWRAALQKQAFYQNCYESYTANFKAITSGS
jgi:glutathione S-transferase